MIITNPECEYEQLEGCIALQPYSNERLEYLGDSVLGGIVSSYLFHRYKTMNEGFLTKLKTKLVRTRMLAAFSRYLGLGKYLLISKHVEEVCDGRKNDRILEDLFEAFLGALFKDAYQDNLDQEQYKVALLLRHSSLLQRREIGEIPESHPSRIPQLYYS